jgi:hypothetical protein
MNNKKGESEEVPVNIAFAHPTHTCAQLHLTSTLKLKQ